MGNEEKERSKQNNIKTKAINSFRFRSEPVRVALFVIIGVGGRGIRSAA